MMRLRVIPNEGGKASDLCNRRKSLQRTMRKRVLLFLHAMYYIVDISRYTVFTLRQ